MKIGIPRALLYYWYGREWELFWQELGYEVKISEPTDRATVMCGAAVGLDELCLPIKIFLGHVAKLAPQVDRIMIPHLIKVESDAYICPKFMGLPDLVAHTLPSLKEKLLIVKVGPTQFDQYKCLLKAAAKYGLIPKNRLKLSFKPNDCRLELLGSLVEKHYQLLSLLEEKRETKLSIGILGHPYCLYDACFNLDLLAKLDEHQVRFVTPEMMPPDLKGIGSGRLPKELFWTIGRNQFDALEWMLSNQRTPVEGFIQLMPFACGPEAIVGDLLERRIRQSGKPLLKLYFEEHSGEAGMITRLEAFLDLIQYRSRVC